MRLKQTYISPDLFKSLLFQVLLVAAVFFILVSIELFSFYNGFLSAFDLVSQSVSGSDFLSFHPFFSFSILIFSLFHPFFLFSLLVFYLPFYIKRKQKPFTSVTFEKHERILLLVCSLTLSWELTTYDYNYYLDNAFYSDRIILLILPFVIYRFPAFVPAFISFSYVYRAQFNYPVDGFMLIDKRILWDVLSAFMAVWYAKLFIKNFKIPFLFFVFCLVGSNYFYSAFAKIIISPHGYEWLFYNQPVDLFYNNHWRGWMSGVNATTITRLADFISSYGLFFQWVVFLVEGAALFLLFSRRMAIFLLASLFFMHTGIFIFGSMIFWKWMVVDLTLILICLYYRDKINVFNRDYFKLSLILIVLSVIWMRPAKIAWADTPYTIFYSYEVEDDSGNTSVFTKNQFNPYHQWIQYDRFSFLTNEKLLPVSGFGYTMNFDLAQKIKAAGPEKILKLEKEEGKSFYDKNKSEKFKNFITVYFKNRNRRLEPVFIPHWLAAPNHIYNHSAGKVWNGKTAVRIFRVSLNKIYTFNGKPVLIDKKVIAEINIPLNE